MFRRATIVALSTALAIGLASCGSDGNKKADPTTTAASGTTTTTTLEATTTAATSTTTTQPDDTTTTTKTNTNTTTTTEAAPVDNETFAQLIDEAQSSFNAADSACDLRVVMDLTKSIPNPSTTGQVKLGVEFLVLLYDAIAEIAPPAQAKNAAAFRTLTKKLQEIAQNSNYDPAAYRDFQSAPPIPGIFAALNAFIEATKDCPGVTR